ITKNAPAVILCHGFSGDKIGKYRLRVRLARALCKNGFAVFRFDFSGHGDSEGEMDDVSIIQELDDLECAINYLKKQTFADINKIGIVGHSLGGEIAILEAAKNKDLKAIVLFAPVADYTKLSAEFILSLKEAEKSGFAERASHKIKKPYFDEMKQFRPIEEISKINAPLLVIHGTADDRVNISSSKELTEKANEPKKLVIINGADHHFAGYNNTMQLINETVKWFLRWLT
ncbi:MAG: alpha/beta fold hydrolase, partial [Nanoarchaeota archaeon]|nr:alpha/beta fold hydrolase [Nanoarchaeota archaeon]